MEKTRSNSKVRKLLRSLGWDVVRYSPPQSSLSRVLELIKILDIQTVIDVGANRGQYASQLRNDGWCGKIISFEPLPDAYRQLKEAGAGDRRWEAQWMGLGDTESELPLCVAGNSVSSSFLDFESHFTEVDDSHRPVSEVMVPVRRLDAVLKGRETEVGKCLLKVDVQGFEKKVINGVEGCIDRVEAIQCELSFVPSYRGAIGFKEMKIFIESKGFVLDHLINGYKNSQTGELVEVDGLFRRKLNL